MQPEDRHPARAWLLRAAAAVVLLIVLLALSVRLFPTLIAQGRDSGIFAYTGWAVSEGAVIYRDVWENKPPGIYFVNALAFVVLGADRWALWILEFVMVYGAVLLAYFVLRRLYPQRGLAWAGALTFLLLARHPGLVWDTNFTETLALLPQAAILATGLLFLRRPGWGWAFGIGLAASAAFLLKQTTIGVAVAFIPAVLLSRHPVIASLGRWRWLGAIILGGLAGLGALVIYLAAHGVLGLAIESAFVAPAALHTWISDEPVALWEPVIQTLRDSPARGIFGPLLPFVLAGMAAAVWLAIRPAADAAARLRRTFGVWAVLTLLADLALTNPTYRAYEHYYITLIPGVALLATLSLYALAEALRDRVPVRAAALVPVIAAGYLLFAAGSKPVRFSYDELRSENWKLNGPLRDRGVAVYVREHTAPGDTVLVWGASSGINFQAQRMSPTQYHYGYGIILPDYTTDAMIEEIARDLAEARPALIVDSTVTDGLRIPPLDPARREDWFARGGRRDLPDLEPIFRSVAENCEELIEFRPTVIYRCDYPN